MREFTESELIPANEDDEDESISPLGFSRKQMDTVRKRFKFYKKTLASQEEYDIARANIGTDLSPEDMMTAMDRVRELQPSEEDKSNQAKRIAVVAETIQETITTLTGEESDTMELAITRIFDRPQDKHHDDRVKVVIVS